MKENRVVSPFNERLLRAGDWVWVHSAGGINPVTGPARVVRVKRHEHELLVEFPDKNPELHSAGGEGLEERCWFVSIDAVTPLPMDFCIFHNNTGATYCLRGDKRRVAGKAQFSPEEADGKDYDPLIGAVIAMARAYGQNPTTVAYKVLKTLSALPEPQVKTVAAAGLEQRVNDLYEQVDFLNDWCSSLTDRCEEIAEKVQPKKKQLVIMKDGERYGVVGTPTKFKTIEGKALRVGDQVTISQGRYSSDTLVVETEEDGPFIMGICIICDPDTGETKGWTLRAKESEPLQAGAVIHTNKGFVTFTVKEEEVDA